MPLTEEQRAARMAELKAARETKYFAQQEAAKIASATQIKTNLEAKGVDVSGFTNLKPADPKPDNQYDYKYMWHVFPGGGGEWRLIRFQNPKITSGGNVTGGNNFQGSTGGFSGTSGGSISSIPKSSSLVNRDYKPPAPPVKTAPIDTILFDSEDTLPIDIMTDLIFEDIGGQELINISRTDTVNGQIVIYQPIKNLTQIQQEYNPNNIVRLQDTSDTYFGNFPIKFEDKVPQEGNGPLGAHVYIDTATGDLVIETINTLQDEEVQVEIVVSGTIYEAGI